MNRPAVSLAALVAALHAGAGWCDTLTFDAGVPDYKLLDGDGKSCAVEVGRPARQVSGDGLREKQTVGGKTVYRFAVSGACRLSENGNALVLTAATAAAVPDTPAPRAAEKTAEATSPSIGSANTPAAAAAPAAPAASAPLAAAAPAAKDVTPKDNLKQYTVDLAPVESPAFVLIGASTENVIRPATARDWSYAIVNGLDRTGKPKAGISIEAAPYQLLNPYLSRDDYATKGAWLRALNNAQVSMATVQGTGSEDKSLKLALGISIPLFDVADLRMNNDFWNCEWETRQTLLKPGDTKLTPDLDDTTSLKAQSKAIEAAFAFCAKKPQFAYAASDKAADRWNRSASSVAFGQSWTSDTGTFGGAKERSKGAWFSYAYGFEQMPLLADRAQAIFHVRRLLNEKVADPADAKRLINQDSSVAGVRFKVGSSHFNGSVEASYQRIHLDGKEDDKVRRFALGLEYKVADNMWLVSSIGGEGGRKNGESNSFVLGALRIGSCTADNCRLK